VYGGHMGANTSNLQTILRLNNKGIKDLREVKQPHLLPVFTKLQVIHLNKNKLTSIPPEIAGDIPKSPKIIEHLVEVNLAGNKLTSLPDEFYLLLNMQRLYLHKNDFTEFPMGVLSFYALQELTLHKNKIKTLPWGIHKLRNLKKLDVSNNLFKCLPQTLGLMKNCESLIVLPQDHLPYYAELTDALVGVHDTVDALEDFLSQQDVDGSYATEKTAADKVRADEQGRMTNDGKLLWKLLRDKEAYEMLKSYMEKEHNHENLLFWREIRKFTQKYYSDREIRSGVLIQDAMTIFKEFIAENSKCTINISAPVMLKLRTVFTDPFHFPAGINQWVFNEAFEQSFALMERDMFRRFRAQDDAKELIARLEAQSVEKVENSTF